MSAYSNPRNGHVVTLQTPIAPSASPPPATALPQIAYELEAFISTARSIEAALHHERAISNQLRDQMTELQSKFTRMMNEADRKVKESHAREDQLKTQLHEAAETERALNERIQSSAQQLDRLREELDRLRVEKFEDRKKFELELELTKASVDHLKQREETLRTTLGAHQSSESALAGQLVDQKKEVERIKTELVRYKAAWGEVLNIDRKAKLVLTDLESFRKRFTEADEQLAIERRRREELEQAVKKEKRDKQIALNCLQSAEIKME
ncbi:MAG: hypothetical protein ACXVBW_12640, partial [Bdellovibrionota bacterium]